MPKLQPACVFWLLVCEFCFTPHTTKVRGYTGQRGSGGWWAAPGARDQMAAGGQRAGQSLWEGGSQSFVLQSVTVPRLAYEHRALCLSFSICKTGTRMEWACINLARLWHTKASLQ